MTDKVKLIAVCIILLNGCTTENSKPYSAKKTASILSKYYGVKITPVDKVGKVVKPSPCAEMKYTFQVEPEGFTFSATTGVTGIIGVPLGFEYFITPNYAAALMLYHREQVSALAKRYDIVWESVQSENDDPIDKIYLPDLAFNRHNDIQYEKLKDVTDFFFAVQNLYNLHLSDDHKCEIYHKPCFMLYYFPADETDRSKAQWAETFWYGVSEDYRFSTDIYTDSNVFLKDINRIWSSKYGKFLEKIKEQREINTENR